MLKRGVLGVRAAEEWLLNLDHACRRGFPDITDSAPGLAQTGAEFGLLPVVPSTKVARAFPRLIADVSPVIEVRSPRIITGWISQLLDPSMQRELRRRTPASQLAVVTSPPRRRTGTARALRDATERAERELVDVRAHRDRLDKSHQSLRAQLEGEEDRAREFKEELLSQRKKLKRMRALCNGATRERDLFEGARDQAIRERDQAIRERDQASLDETLGQLDRSNLKLENATVICERDSLKAARATALRDCERHKSALEQARGKIDALERANEEQEERARESQLSRETETDHETEKLRAELATLTLNTRYLKELLRRGPLPEGISPGSLFRRTLKQPNGVLVRPPGECKLPWFLVIVERQAALGPAEIRTALVSPASQVALQIRETNIGVWDLEIENYAAREGRPGRTESYGRGSLSAMMKLAEKVVAAGFPTGRYFREWHGADDDR